MKNSLIFSNNISSIQLKYFRIIQSCDDNSFLLSNTLNHRGYLFHQEISSIKKKTNPDSLSIENINNPEISNSNFDKNKEAIFRTFHA